MKAQVVGYMQMSGTGKESKKPYSFARLYMLAPLSPVQNETMTRRCAGFEVMEVDVAPEAHETFMKQTYPCALDLETDMLPKAGKLTTVVIGVKLKAA